MENKRLIDANALKKAIRAESWKQERKVQLTLDFIDIIVDEQPTVDAVEVVRCKDCKHYMLWEDSDDEKTCAKSIGLMVSAPDDFCSYGERRTHDQT